MANQDHQSLSQFLKDVHGSLRRTSSKLGAEKAWHEHCKNHDVLEKYADCMQKLATIHWDKNCASDSSEASSRIEWTVNYCNNYFIQENYKKYIEKEKAIASKINLHLECEDIFTEPLKLLDVGSCYNPFKQYKFDVLAIDLCPANETVLQCDFLSVPLGDGTAIDKSKVLQLQRQSFDILTFCFLLEYIPSSNLRLSACQKAYELLNPGGLLVINTPDSKHVGANSKIMKCWRYTLAMIGFNRIKYEKFRHMHCMAFRKSLHKDIANRWAKLHEEPYMKFEIQIPQDFQKYDGGKIEGIDQSISSTIDFAELPFGDTYSLS